MYIRGGFNVYPAEVEAALQGMPGVVACAVAGFGDPVLGEKGRAFVVGAPGHGLTADGIREFCRSRIADYKAPDDVVFVDALPLIGPGKVDRARLDELHAAAAGARA
jgi:fatty-acyl-CoA synthase